MDRTPLPSLDTAKALVQVLPHLRDLAGTTVVIKYGGNAMATDDHKVCFAQDVVMLKMLGIKPVVVHGGGPQIADMLDRLGIESHFIQGIRVTDVQTAEVVEMVLGGRVNKEIVSLINNNGGKAIGITGKDASLITAVPFDFVDHLPNPISTERCDTNFTGTIKNIDTGILTSLQSSGFIPVIAPIGTDSHGNTYNINADLVAGSLAEALQAQKLLLLTNTTGVFDNNNCLVSTLDLEQAHSYIANGTIKAGMLPKVQCAISAVSNGVDSAHIINGCTSHALLQELFTNQSIGTEVIKSAQSSADTYDSTGQTAIAF